MATSVSHLVVLAALGAAVSGCASPRIFPEIPEDKRSPVVLSGYVVGVTHLAEFSACSDPDVLCIDPPPFELIVDVTDVLYGYVGGRRLRVATTSHFGALTYTRKLDDHRLFYIVTDGKSFVLPKYRSSVLEQDSAGRWAIPIWASHVPWGLPCSVYGLKRAIPFPTSLSEDVDNIETGEIAAHPDLYLQKGNRVRPRYGLYLSDIRAHLASERPTAVEMDCGE